jgi:hypothetical protein
MYCKIWFTFKVNFHGLINDPIYFFMKCDLIPSLVISMLIYNDVILLSRVITDSDCILLWNWNTYMCRVVHRKFKDWFCMYYFFTIAFGMNIETDTFRYAYILHLSSVNCSYLRVLWKLVSWFSQKLKLGDTQSGWCSHKPLFFFS